jgi:hypothetical protein
MNAYLVTGKSKFYAFNKVVFANTPEEASKLIEQQYYADVHFKVVSVAEAKDDEQ